MFGIGGFELFIILVFGFLIFGPDKLPEIAKTVGKGIARFREAQQEMNDVLGDEKLIDLDDPNEPIKDPMEALDRIAKRQEEKKAGSAKSASRSSSTKADDVPDAAEDKQESFTERKARYERERAARKAAEAEAAAAAKAEAEAASAERPVEAQSPVPVSEPEPVPAPESESVGAQSPVPEEASDSATMEPPAEGGDE